MMRLGNHVCKCNRCLISSSQTKFSVYGDKKSYILENPGRKTISKYVVDDCLLAALRDEEKCDYLFVNNSNGYFVELKGSDVPKAIKQLISTIGYLRNDVRGNLLARIVCSKFRRAPDTKSSQEYLKLMKLTDDNLIIKSKQLTESI